MSTTAAARRGRSTCSTSPSAIEKKFKRAVTDSGAGIVPRARQAGHHEPDRHPRRRPRREPAEIEREFAGARYGDFKAAVAAAVVEYLPPVRERYAELRADEAALEAVLADGAERARAIAAATLADVRAAMGVGPPR